jgi:cell division protein FtsB
MNKNQRLTLFGGIVAIVGTCLMPPWYSEDRGSMGYHLLFLAPDRGAPTVDMGRLLLEWVIVGGLVAALMVLLKGDDWSGRNEARDKERKGATIPRRSTTLLLVAMGLTMLLMFSEAQAMRVEKSKHQVKALKVEVDDLTEERDSLKEELDGLKDKISRLSEEMTELDSATREVDESGDELDLAIRGLDSGVDNWADAVPEVESKSDSHQSQLDTLKEKVEAVKEKISDLDK